MWIIPTLVLISLFVIADNDKKTASSEKPAAKRAQPAKAKVARKRQNAAKKAPEVTRQQEEAATAFVTQHHDQLLELLIHLKDGVPQEYNKAIRDLARTSDRLETMAGRDKTRYKMELKLWQAKSRRQLLTARLQMNRDDELIEQIRETLEEERDVQLAILKHERERFAARVKKLDEQIAKQERTRQSSIDRQIATLTKAAKSGQRKVKASKRKQPTSKNIKKPT
ncbi:MAG: hypothetical protein CMJ64_00635 [Planctomycetaceae bacterium]|jgi:hypothetical protein|nr:hypothetical protein [Planctomycetaceae bacterium]